MASPRVSVILPNYNHERFLVRRMESVLAQSFRDFEIIYLDDASTDESEAIIAPYRDDPRVRTFRNEVNSGSPFHQWNRGVREARGELIWIAESDDFCEPDLLETLVGLLDANPFCGLAYARSRIVDETDAPTGDPAVPSGERWGRDFIAPGREEIRDHLAASNTIPNASAVLFRRALYLECGGVPEGMSYAGDWWIWCRILMRSDLAYSARILNSFRRHDTTRRAFAVQSGLRVREGYQVLALLQNEGFAGGSTFEKGLGEMVRKWVESFRAAEGGLPWRTHRELYTLGRKVDPRLLPRLLRGIMRGR